MLFICTANSLDTIPGPLKDRMEIIQAPTPTRTHTHAPRERARMHRTRTHARTREDHTGE